MVLHAVQFKKILCMIILSYSIAPVTIQQIADKKALIDAVIDELNRREVNRRAGAKTKIAVFDQFKFLNACTDIRSLVNDAQFYVAGTTNSYYTSAIQKNGNIDITIGSEVISLNRDYWLMIANLLFVAKQYSETQNDFHHFYPVIKETQYTTYVFLPYSTKDKNVYITVGTSTKNPIDPSVKQKLDEVNRKIAELQAKQKQTQTRSEDNAIKKQQEDAIYNFLKEIKFKSPYTYSERANMGPDFKVPVYRKDGYTNILFSYPEDRQKLFNLIKNYNPQNIEPPKTPEEFQSKFVEQSEFDKTKKESWKFVIIFNGIEFNAIPSFMITA